MKLKTIGALAALGMLSAASVQGATVNIDYTGDNKVNQLWTVDSSLNKSGNLLNPVPSGSNGDWEKTSSQDLTLANDTYTVVFNVQNGLGAPTLPSDGLPASFLAQIKGDVAADVYTGTIWEYAVVDPTDGSCSGSDFSGCSWTTAVLTDGYNSGADDTVNSTFNSNNIWTANGNGDLAGTFDSNSKWIWDANGDGGNFGSAELFLRTSITVVPLPPAAILFVSAIAGVSLIGRRRRKQQQSGSVDAAIA